MSEPIVGICGGCGRSIKATTHWATTQMVTWPGMGPGPTLHLCESCLKGLVDMEIKFRAKKRGRKCLTIKEVLMIQPKGPRLLVKRIDAPKPESILIEIPDTIEPRESMYALVLAIGNKVEGVSVADTVILGAYCGSPVTVDFDGEQIDALIVMSDDVLAVVED